MAARTLFALAIVVAQVIRSECGSPLPQCLADLNLGSGDTLPEDVGVRCAREVFFPIQSIGLVGTIPESVGDLSLLTSLVFTNNGFTGGLPTSIGKLQNLTSLFISGDVGGRMPDEVWSLPSLTSLVIVRAEMTGSIPTTTLGLSGLGSLVLKDSNFDGTLPTELLSLPSLSILDVSDNNFGGDIQQIQSLLCAIEAKQNRAKILPGNSFTGVITDPCMYTQSIVPSSSFTASPTTASPTSSPASPAVSAYKSFREVVAAGAGVFALCLTSWQL